MRRVFALVALLVPAYVSAAASGPLSAEELFRPASVHSASLSPHGNYFGALISDNDDKGGLLVIDLATYQPSPLHGSRSFDIHSFCWLDDERLLFQVSKEHLYSWGLFAVRAERLDDPYPINSFDAIKIIGVPKARPGRVIVWIIHSAENSLHGGQDLVELDAMRPQRSIGQTLGGDDVLGTYTTPSGEVPYGWSANEQGDLALCWTWAQGRTHVYRYTRPSGKWRPLQIPEGASLMRVDPDERFVWVVTYEKAQGFALRRMDVESKALAPPVLIDADYDISRGHLSFSPTSGALLGVTYSQQQTRTVWFSKQYAVIQASVDRANPNTINTLVDYDAAQQKFIFSLSSATSPSAYAVLDLKEKAIHLVAESAPWLKNRPLLDTKVVSYRTRDGVTLQAYLTAPPGVTPERRAPMVVLPHGGPWARDVLTFDPDAQFLASRGYVVLQPQYRGSSGYTPAISEEYKYDFVTMHNDVTDATKAQLASGLVDPKHVAIMGASFGGFLAISGAAFENDLYCCAITECGVFDWERHIASKEDYSRPAEYEVLQDKVYAHGRNREALAAHSPLAHADQIHIPVLIAHGTDDGIVDVSQSRRLAATLKDHGIPHETFFRKLEGHGFFNYKNRVDFYHRVEAFLAANLGALAAGSAK